MWKRNASSIKAVSVDLLTPQVTIIENCGDYGNFLAGQVTWETTSPAPIKHIELEVSGRYKAEWVEGVGPSRTQHSIDKVIYQDTQNLLPFQPVAPIVTDHMPPPVYQKSTADSALIPHGHHCLPFKLQLPDWLPPTICMQQGAIEYSVLARVKSVASCKQSVRVVRVPAKPHDDYERSGRAAMYWRTLEETCGTRRVGVQVNSRTASPGDQLLIGIQLEAPADHSLNSIHASARLIEETVLRSPNGKAKLNVRVVGEFNDVMCRVDRMPVEKLRLVIPKVVRHDCQSSFVGVRHRLEIEVGLRDSGKSVRVPFEVDVAILPCTDDLALPSYRSASDDLLV